MCDIILQGTYLDLLPIELLSMVISQIDDIDIKRHFGCYNKIRLEEYKNLSDIIISSPIDINNGWMVSTIYNFKKNLYDFSERKKHKIPNDHIVITHHKEKSYIMIHRLVFRSNYTDDYIQKLENEYGYRSSVKFTNSPKSPIYLDSPMDNFRWEVIKTIKTEICINNEL